MRPGSGRSRRRTRSRCMRRASSVSATRSRRRPSVSSAVEGDVELEEAVEVRSRDRRLLVAEVARQRLARLGGKAARRLGGHLRLDRPARHHPLQHVIEADARDVGPPLRLDPQQPLVGEPVDRGVHRQTRDAEAQAERGLVDRRAREQLAADDRLLEGEVHLVGLRQSHAARARLVQGRLHRAPVRLPSPSSAAARSRRPLDLRKLIHLACQLSTPPARRERGARGGAAGMSSEPDRGRDGGAAELLRAVGVSKRFAGVTALDRVDFDLGAGEVHALVGENGAGKSTLMKILSGVHTDYDGEVRIGGVAAALRQRPRRRAGRGRDHPPGAEPGAGARRRRQHLPRARAADRRAVLDRRAMVAAGAAAARPARDRARPRGAGRGPARRRAAARRDRQGAVARGARS